MVETPEEKVLSFLIKNQTNCDFTIERHHIDRDYFTDSTLQSVASIVYGYYGKFSKVVTQDIFVRELDKSEDIKDIARNSVWLKYQELQKHVDVDETSIDYWLGELRKERLTRQFDVEVKEACREIDAGEGIYRAYEKLSMALSNMQDLTDSGEEVTRSINDEGWIKERIDLLHQKTHFPENFSGVKTGLTELDRLTNGIMSGEMWVFVSRTNVGKSALLNVIAHNAFRLSGKNVMFAGLEMASSANSVRFDALASGLPARGIQYGTLTEEEIHKYEETLIDLTYEKNKLFFIPQKKAQTVQQIQRELVLTERKFGVKIDLLVVDYLNILSTMAPVKARLSQHDMVRMVAEDTRALGWLHGVGIATAAQLNRLGADSKADIGTEAVAGSDYIGNTADFMMRLVQTPEDAERNILKGVILKSRRTERPTFEFSTDLNRMYIGDVDWDMSQMQEGDYDNQAT